MKLQQPQYDIIIIGAGPAGAACAIKLGNSGLKVAVVDKAVFPRDKTCGDALSVDVVNQLEMLSSSLAVQFEKLSSKVPSYGVRIVAPDHRHIDIPFFNKGEKRCGYICKRIDFDNLLVKEMRSFSNIHLIEGQQVNNINIDKTGVTVFCKDKDITSYMLIGADGANSMVRNFLSKMEIARKHHSAGLRVYYKGVNNFQQENYIELHFFKEALPGYLWIFPLPNGEANVGIGILSSIVSKKKINLKELLNRLIITEPSLASRFKNASAIETVKGFGLPLGSVKRNISGERFLLLGDAAGLIDPFSGEGIANAIRSGRVAAEHLIDSFNKQDFSASFNKAYDKEIYNRMWKEFKISRSLQNLCKYPRLFNWVVNKAGKSKYLNQLLIDSLANADVKSILTKAPFYFRLLFKKDSSK